MYFVIVIAFTVVLPILSIVIEALSIHSDGGLLFLIGKWFLFWAVGVRLLSAGLRQMLTPSFTAEKIFETSDPGAQKVVSELGIANVSLGTTGLLTVYFSNWMLPVAVCAALFYGLAGIRHLFNSKRNLIENVATATDLWVALVLIVFVAGSVLSL